MPSIFTQIIQKNIPCYAVHEDEHHLAFLDIQPLKEGHVLVVPKIETDYLFDMPDHEYLQLHAFAQKVAIGLKKAIPCTRIGTAVVGLEVPHVHIHLIPIDSVADMNFLQPRLALTPEKFTAIASRISNAIS
jgi:histidine triad (HIT) family protein